MLRNLHFNMLLLNPLVNTFCNTHTPSFTFQYASIKPLSVVESSPRTSEFTFQYASIKPIEEVIVEELALHLHFNMLLLNPGTGDDMNGVIEIYISICFY